MKKNLMYALPLTLILMWACETPLETSDSAEVQSLDSDITALAKPSDGETAGNNLSFPVIWSDGVEKPLRGTVGSPVLNGLFFTADSYNWYVQNDLNNTWQAQSLNAITDAYESPVVVSTIDWGDNLEAKAWPFGAQVRVETVLYKTLTTPLNGYTMQIEDPTISGIDEVWGTNGVTYPSNEATVYSGTAKLVIQQLLKDRDDPSLSTTWDAGLSRWTGDVGPPLFEGGVWEAVDGPGDYNAEVNVQGKVIYGYNWVTRKTAAGPGDYRITFVLDATSQVTYNTDFDASTTILAREEEEEEVVIQDEPDLGGGVAMIDDVNNLTYMDVRLTLKNGSGKPGGNDGKGNGGGGGGGKPDHAGNGGGGQGGH